MSAFPQAINDFRNSYAEMFGEVPPLPKAKFEFSADVDPEALLLVGKLHSIVIPLADRSYRQGV